MIAILAVELNEDVLAREAIVRSRSHDGIGDAIYSYHRNALSLGMERVGDVHVGHDLVARFVHIVAHLIGFDFNHPKIGLRVDEPWIDRHTGGIDDGSAPRNGCARGTDSGELSVFHHHHAVLDYAVSNGEQLATANRYRPTGLSL